MKRVCANCGKGFDATGKGSAQKRFCSPRCKWTWTNKNRRLKPNVRYTCEACGGKVATYVSPSAYHKSAFRFCSHKCRRGSKSNQPRTSGVELRPARIVNPKVEMPQIRVCKFFGKRFSRNGTCRIYCSRQCNWRHASKVRDREKQSKYTRLHRARNAERYRQRDRTYYRANPQKWKDARDRYRARKLNAPVYDLTERQWREIKKRHKHLCAYCGKRRKLTRDHVVPLSRGGSHTASNIVPACKSCNSKKWNRTAEEFANAGT